MIPNPRSNPNSCFPNNRQKQQQQQMYGTNSRTANVTDPSMDPASLGTNDHYNSLLYNLSLLKEKFHQVQSLVMIMPQQQTNHSNLASLTTFIQEIIVAASSMIFTCQQMAIGNNNDNQFQNQPQIQSTRPQDDSLYHEPGPPGASVDWYEEEYNNNASANLPRQANNDETVQFQEICRKNIGSGDYNNYDIIELNAVDLLAKYTHYCQVCGKGFKRDANLRMHMRAHGDEYKSAAALTNPAKRLKADLDKHTAATATAATASAAAAARKYSCPQEGCRWNRRHEKFQPLKSMICAKNHYKRSHCPKMYVCKRCNRKQFSVLSDLRTHEKHCGDLKWQCSCGTTFSRKDKLMGHVGLFVGHAPMVASDTVAKRIKKGASSSSFITI